MDFFTLVRENYDDFVKLCKAYKVNTLYAFGSSVTDRFNVEKSDLDILVDLAIDDPADRGEALLSLWNELEELFGRKVDLLTVSSLKNPYLKSNIERTKKLIYDREKEKVFV